MILESALKDLEPVGGKRDRANAIAWFRSTWNLQRAREEYRFTFKQIREELSLSAARISKIKESVLRAEGHQSLLVRLGKARYLPDWYCNARAKPRRVRKVQYSTTKGYK